MSKTKKDAVVRKERPTDIADVRSLNIAAFPSEAEADLVDELRVNGKATVSLVAVHDERIIGHILFSPVMMESNVGQDSILGLAPMAVLPAFQRRGVGSLLVTTGLAQCKRNGVGAVVVLGNPDYYSRFDFQTASLSNIGCLYDVPDKYFMALELADGVLSRISGTAQYQPEFSGV